MTTVAVIQARMTSSRLPGKVLAPLRGKPVLWHLVHRLRKCKTLDGIAIATSSNAADDPVATFAAAENITVVRGSEHDVLGRFVLAADTLNADIIVRVTGDAPLVDADTVDLLVQTLIEKDGEFCTGNPDHISIHQGFSPFTTECLRRLARVAGDDPMAREHVTAYFKLHPDFLRTVHADLNPAHRFDGARISVDTPADLAFLERVYQDLQAEPGELDLAELVELLRVQPTLLDINAHVVQRSADQRAHHLLIRCDGGSDVGLGHIYRCLGLADELREKYGVGITFALAHDDVGERLIREAGFEVARKDADSERGWLRRLQNEKSADGIVFDIRNDLSQDDITALRRTGVTTICLDDASDRRLACDLVFYPPVPQVECLTWPGFTGAVQTGWSWALLRREFAHSSERSDPSRTQVLVTMGGSDPYGFTARAIDALDKLDRDVSVKVVVGAGYRDTDSLRERLRASRADCELLVDVKNMVALMNASDVAIIAFGTTAYELGALGIPAVHICATPDHAESSSAFARAGMAVSLGFEPQLDVERLVTEARRLIDDPGLRAQMTQACLDAGIGHGAANVARAIVERLS